MIDFFPTSSGKRFPSRVHAAHDPLIGLPAQNLRHELTQLRSRCDHRNGQRLHNLRERLSLPFEDDSLDPSIADVENNGTQRQLLLVRDVERLLHLASLAQQHHIIFRQPLILAHVVDGGRLRFDANTVDRDQHITVTDTISLSEIRAHIANDHFTAAFGAFLVGDADQVMEIVLLLGKPLAIVASDQEVVVAKITQNNAFRRTAMWLESAFFRIGQEGLLILGLPAVTRSWGLSIR